MLPRECTSLVLALNEAEVQAVISTSVILFMPVLKTEDTCVLCSLSHASVRSTREKEATVPSEDQTFLLTISKNAICQNRLRIFSPIPEFVLSLDIYSCSGFHPDCAKPSKVTFSKTIR